MLVLENANFETFTLVVPDFVERVKALKAVHEAKMAVARGASGGNRPDAFATATAATATTAATAATTTATNAAAATTAPATAPAPAAERDELQLADAARVPRAALASQSVTASVAAERVPSAAVAPLSAAEADDGPLGLGAWVDSLARNAPVPTQIIQPRRQIGRSVVVVSSDVGFVGLTGRAAFAGAGPGAEHSMLLRQAKATAEATRARMLDPTLE